MTDDSQSESYYVYAYVRAVTSKNGEAGTPYYIGKGKGGRAFEGHRVRVPKDRSRIVIIEEDLNEAEAFELEISEIAKYGRLDLATGILRNLTNGGEGTSGRILSDNSRRKLSDSLKKYFDNPDNRAKQSASQNKPEYRARKSATAKKRFEDPEYRARVTAFLVKLNKTPESRVKNSDGLKKRYENQEYKDRHIAAMKKWWIARKAKNQSSSATLPI